MDITDREPKQINLSILMYSVWRNKWLVLLISAICALAVFSYLTVVNKPQFRATTQIYIVNNEKTSIEYADLQSAKQLTRDYEELIKNVSVTEQVVYALGLDMSPGGLASKISISSPEDTRIIFITVSDTDPYRARDIANTVRIVAAEKIMEIMKIDAVNTVSEAKIPTSSSGSGAKRISLFVFAIAFMACVSVIAILDIANDTIKTPDDLTEYVGISTLGSIPVEQRSASRKKNCSNTARGKDK